MAFSFQSALFGVGALLIIIGLAVGLMAAGQLEKADGVVDALSAGVTSSFFALFSGVLIGVGGSLAATGALLYAKSRLARISAAFILTFLSLLFAANAVGSPQSFGFALLLSFFAAGVFSGCMLVAAVVFYFADLLRTHLRKPQG